MAGCRRNIQLQWLLIWRLYLPICRESHRVVILTQVMRDGVCFLLRSLLAYLVLSAIRFGLHRVNIKKSFPWEKSTAHFSFQVNELATHCRRTGTTHRKNAALKFDCQNGSESWCAGKSSLIADLSSRASYFAIANDECVPLGSGGAPTGASYRNLTRYWDYDGCGNSPFRESW